MMDIDVNNDLELFDQPTDIDIQGIAEAEANTETEVNGEVVLQQISRAAEDSLMKQSFPVAFRIGEFHFTTAEQMLATLDTCDPDEAYGLATECLEKLIYHRQHVEVTLCRLYEFVSSKKLWKGSETDSEFQNRWAEVIAIRDPRQRDAQYIKKILAKASSVWGTSNAERFF